MFIPDPDPGSGSWFFSQPGSRIQGSKRHRIPDLDPQHWFWTSIGFCADSGPDQEFFFIAERVIGNIDPYPDPRLTITQELNFTCSLSLCFFTFFFSVRICEANFLRSNVQENLVSRSVYRSCLFPISLALDSDPDPWDHIKGGRMRIRIRNSCPMCIVPYSVGCTVL
jgi:hypothetical protein